MSVNGVCAYNENGSTQRNAVDEESLSFVYFVLIFFVMEAAVYKLCDGE